MDKTVKIASSDELGIKLHPNLFIKLGGDPKQLTSTVYLKENNNPVPYGVDVHMGYNHLFVYLASCTLLEDIEAPILRVVPFE
ncbi:hypothetical protein ACF0H5_004603 [Mactra antiquata]